MAYRHVFSIGRQILWWQPTLPSLTASRQNGSRVCAKSPGLDRSRQECRSVCSSGDRRFHSVSCCTAYCCATQRLFTVHPKPTEPVRLSLSEEDQFDIRAADRSFFERKLSGLRLTRRSSKPISMVSAKHWHGSPTASGSRRVQLLRHAMAKSKATIEQEDLDKKRRAIVRLVEVHDLSRDQVWPELEALSSATRVEAVEVDPRVS